MRYLPASLRLPGVCASCRTPVIFDGKRWKEHTRGAAHACPPQRLYCGAWMPIARERCARRPGHVGGQHRTRYALDNQNLRRAA